MTPTHPHFTELLGREVTRLKRTTAVLLLASFAVTLISVDSWRRRQDLGQALADLASCERACVHEVAVSAPPAAIVPARMFDAPLPVEAILDVPLEVLCPGGAIKDATLRGASAAPAVHLVNLWQIDCASCRREFPELARALASAPAVRFLAIDAEDVRPAADAYEEAQRRHGMPTPTASLIYRARRGLRDTLERLAATPPIDHRGGLVYPLSFVLDCQGRMRWWKVGAIHADEVRPLSGLLAALSGEPKCRADAPTPRLCRRSPKHPRTHHRPPNDLPPMLPLTNSGSVRHSRESLSDPPMDPEHR